VVADACGKATYLALSALKEEGATVAELADRLGYQSEAAFNRAFKRIIGVSPGAMKRNGDESSSQPIGVLPV
jgi:AraC-like DNA-binding protein